MSGPPDRSGFWAGSAGGRFVAVEAAPAATAGDGAVWSAAGAVGPAGAIDGVAPDGGGFAAAPAPDAAGP